MQIKIAVAVNAQGDWYAYGHSGVDLNDNLHEVLGEVQNDSPTRLHIVSADIQPPSVDSIDGQAEQAGLDIQVDAAKKKYEQAAAYMESLSHNYDDMRNHYFNEIDKLHKIKENKNINNSFWHKLFG